MIVLWCCLLVGNEIKAKERACDDTLKYRITFSDKGETPYSLQKPERFLSPKALERRRRQGIAVDSTDLPVCQSYIDQVVKLGVKPVARGKWENFLTVACQDTAWIAQARQFPFVRSIEWVWVAPHEEVSLPVRETLNENFTVYPDTVYGAAWQQIHFSGGDRLHQAGFRGEGMTIAITDAGFHNADRDKALQKAHVAGVRSFVPSDSNLFVESSHGASVFSCMASNLPHVMVGTAPEATYWLLRTEDESSETLVEQDYWAAAVEFADSVGVDMVNTSLGYYTFDRAEWNYNYRHLDGHHALISRQASHLADKGMVMVCSAGNAGAGKWKKITPPADAEGVLTVGALDREGLLATFSSIGNTTDNRIKPDVMGLGELTAVIRGDGSQGRANGTSYSTPVMCGMVACLWQALPHLTAKQLIEVVRSSGDRASFPDNIYGYGVPDLWKAYETHKQ